MELSSSPSGDHNWKIPVQTGPNLAGARHIPEPSQYFLNWKVVSHLQLVVAGKHLSTPAVSVVMITYNHSRFIEGAIASVLDGLPHNAEVLVVDDGSTDDTRDKLQAVNNPIVRILFKENGGPSSALNYGIVRAKGEYIAIMSGDDISLPNGIAKRVKFIQESGADIVSSYPLFIDDDGNSVESAPMSAAFEPSIDESNLYTLKRLLFVGNFICAPSVLMRHAVFDKVGLHLDSLFQLQDYELWIRSSMAGFRISVSREPFVKYRLHANNLSSAANHGRTVWELTAILRNLMKVISRDEINNLSGKHDSNDSDLVASALFFLDSDLLALEIVSQELLEIAMLDNEAAFALRTRYGFSSAAIMNRRKIIAFQPDDLRVYERRIRRIVSIFGRMKRALHARKC